MLQFLANGFADELEKLSAPPHPQGMRRDESILLDLMRKMHPSVGGDDPLMALQAGRMEAVEQQVRRRPFLEWLSRVLKTGEVSRSPAGEELLPGRHSMERVLSVAEPLTQEQVAIGAAAPRRPLLSRLTGAVDERRAARGALKALMRR